MKIFDELKYRGLVDNITDNELIEKINNESLTFYIGTDPTADSLHIGHFSSLLVAKRLKDAGHKPLLLLGGGTGLIGDPKPNAERAMISKEAVNKNIKGLKNQLENIFGFKVVNNFDWISKINMIDYLRDYGKYFNINYMLDKDTVKRRLDIGITYTEFSYMILQSLDFLNLYEQYNCILQIGGADQWGNITSGLELIRKKNKDAKVYGMTMPLITKADGTKFGKTEGGSIWFDKNKTTSYEMYQFFINTEDEKVIEYLKKLTFLTKEEIEQLEISVLNEPHLRLAQTKLAKEVITFLHGEEEYQKAINISKSLFSGDITKLSADEVEVGFKGVPNITIKEEINIVELLILCDDVSSKREAREFINNGAILINGNKALDENMIITKDNLVDNKFIVLKRGKKKYYLIRFEQ